MNNSALREQNVFLYGRKRINVSGIKSVDSFDENFISMTTDSGEHLCVEGNGLVVKDVDLESGSVEAEGNVSAIFYESERAEKTGILSAIFKRA